MWILRVQSEKERRVSSKELHMQMTVLFYTLLISHFHRFSEEHKPTHVNPPSKIVI
jgi:hypothetical protein